MNNRYFSKQQTRDWIGNLPSKRISSKVVIKDKDGKFVLVKPNYKDGWQLPGGVVEVDESPVDGAIREIREELGLNLSHDQLKFKACVYSPKYDPYLDFIHFFFEVDIEQDDIANIKLNTNELERYELINTSQLHDYEDKYWAKKYEQLIESKQPIYLL